LGRLVAISLARLMNVPEPGLADVYYTSLLLTLGCTPDGGIPIGNRSAHYQRTVITPGRLLDERRRAIVMRA
jgi:hypothetical protein